jgi:hypothetical protein
MPEELALVLVAFVLGVWLIVKVFQMLARAVGETQKGAIQAILHHNEARYLRKKSGLSSHVKVLIPNQLDSAEKQLDLAASQLAQAKTSTKWDAHRPMWAREEFKPYSLPPQDERYEEMDADDIQSILQPSGRAWLNEEASLLARQCQYPSGPPVKTTLCLKPVPTATLELAGAVLEYDRASVSEKKIARYFSSERNAVSEYNRRRSELIARRDALNKQIEEWNEKSRLDWEAFGRRSELLASEELSAFGLASQLYVAKCEEQKRHFRAMLEGHKAGSKSGVISRTSYVLGVLQMPPSVPRTWEIDFDEEQRILIVEIGLPDVVHQPPFKTVVLKKGLVRRPLSQTERKEIIPRVHPAILLRVAYEVFRNDAAQAVNLLVLNGWITFDDPKHWNKDEGVYRLANGGKRPGRQSKPEQDRSPGGL